MSKKRYDSPEYIGQELKRALSRLFEKSYGITDMNIIYNYNHDKKRGEIRYEVSGFETHITITKGKDGYHLEQEIKSVKKPSSQLEEKIDDHTFKEKMSLERSDEGRLSDTYTKKLAESTLNRIKNFGKARSQGRIS